jgi:hypothetical protein
MAKRKGSATGGRKKAAKRASKTSGAARKRVAKKPAARKPAVAARRKAAKSQATKSKATKKSKAAKKPVARRVAAPKRTASKKTASKQRGAKKAAPRKTAPKKIARRVTTAARSAPPRAKVASKVARPVAKAAVRRRVDATPMRKAPALNRDRRTVSEEDMVPMPPSTLDLDRSASAVRTGRRAMRERFDQHTETSPALTGGDVDADWESAYSVGDEAPGGDNPTPDQDLVDDIGRAVGVEYQDNEELKGEEKIADRDRHRWELDPASAEDYDEH